MDIEQLLKDVSCRSSDESADDYNMNQRREDFIQEMVGQGYGIVYPKANELQIDIDDEQQYEVFKRASACLGRNWNSLYEGPAPVVEEHPSKSGLPSRHITITLPFDVEPWQRIALQASLGSDPMRELLSSFRMMAGDVSPTLFVEAPADELELVK